MTERFLVCSMCLHSDYTAIVANLFRAVVAGILAVEPLQEKPYFHVLVEDSVSATRSAGVPHVLLADLNRVPYAES